MDCQNGIAHSTNTFACCFAFAQDPTLVNHLLRPAFNFGVAALNGIKVQFGRVRARGHGTSRAAAHADAHAGAAELNQQTSRRKCNLVGLGGINHAQAARDHDGLVVAALNGVGGACYALLKFTEVTQQIRATKLVVKSRATERAFGHDL